MTGGGFAGCIRIADSFTCAVVSQGVCFSRRACFSLCSSPGGSRGILSRKSQLHSLVFVSLAQTSPKKNPAIRNLPGSKADLLPPVFSLRAVLMVQWLKAVLMHHTSYLASVSFTFIPLDRCCFRPRPAGGPRCPKFPRIQSESERLQFNSTNRQKRF